MKHRESSPGLANDDTPLNEQIADFVHNPKTESLEAVNTTAGALLIL